MSLIRRTSPFGDVLSLRQAMDHLFEESFIRPRNLVAFGDQIVPIDVYATPDHLVVEAALPGLRPEQVDVTLTGNALTISGSTEQPAATNGEANAGYLYQEIRRGSFSRSISLPADIETEGATATFENGLLRLSIPKAERTKPRRITVAPPSAEGEASAGPGAQAQPARVATGEAAEAVHS
jgi:HSP20 family protein